MKVFCDGIYPTQMEITHRDASRVSNSLGWSISGQGLSLPLCFHNDCLNGFLVLKRTFGATTQKVTGVIPELVQISFSPLQDWSQDH